MIGFCRRLLICSKGNKRISIVCSHQEIEFNNLEDTKQFYHSLQIQSPQQLNQSTFRGMVRLAYPNRDDVLDDVGEDLRFLQVPQKSFQQALSDLLNQQLSLEELDYLIYVETQKQEEQKQQQYTIIDFDHVEFKSRGWVDEAINFLMIKKKIFQDLQFCYQVLIRSKIEDVFLTQQNNNNQFMQEINFNSRKKKLHYWEVQLLENIKSVVNMMYDFGAQNSNVQKALLQNPDVLAHDAHELFLVLQFLQANGMPRKHGWIVLCENPQVLYLPLYQLKKKLFVLKELGVNLNAFLKRTMVLRGAFREMDKWEESLKFLHELGLLKDPNIVAKGPRILFLQQTNAIHVIYYLVDIGVPKDKIYQVIRDFPEVLTCSVKYKLKREVSTLSRILSASKEEVAQMIVRLPQILSYNIQGQQMQTKVRFLKQQYGKEFRRQLLNFPALLSYSLFQRIGPRSAFVKHLNLDNVKMGRLLQNSDENFALVVCGSSIQYYQIFKQQWQDSVGLEWKQLEQAEQQE
eukprot:TRINITY_DN8101_c0_g2_i1.p1 TRINITY_DN8101_c0_g2~~TRINITY_DN8101_c0_g2_i1.p1  ORF type:complete len:517 (-),score=71.73 TRINITY_DN8101_c0_g2_i1:223-1773(-)